MTEKKNSINENRSTYIYSDRFGVVHTAHKKYYIKDELENY